MAEWMRVCRLDEVPEQRARESEAAGLRLAVYRHEGSVVVLSERCPHAGGSLAQGWVEDGEAVCPLHRWRFRLRDGRCTTVRGEGVYRFPAEVRGDEVWVLA